MSRASPAKPETVVGCAGAGGSRCGMASGSPAIWTSLFMWGFLGGEARRCAKAELCGVTQGDARETRGRKLELRGASTAGTATASLHGAAEPVVTGRLGRVGH